MEFEYAIRVRDIARGNADKYSDILNSFKDGDLISNEVRKSIPYVQAQKNFNLYFNEERKINQYLNKVFKKELREIRTKKNNDRR